MTKLFRKRLQWRSMLQSNSWIGQLPPLANIYSSTDIIREKDHEWVKMFHSSIDRLLMSIEKMFESDSRVRSTMNCWPTRRSLIFWKWAEGLCRITAPPMCNGQSWADSRRRIVWKTLNLYHFIGICIINSENDADFSLMRQKSINFAPINNIKACIHLITKKLPSSYWHPTLSICCPHCMSLEESRSCI